MIDPTAVFSTKVAYMDMNCSQPSVSKFFSIISEDVLTLICTFLDHHAQRKLGCTCVSYIHMCPITFQCFENLLKQQKLTPVNLLPRLHKVCLNIGDCLYQYNRITNAIQNSIDASNTNNAPNTNNHAQFHRLEVYIMENSTGRPQLRFIPSTKHGKIPNLFSPAKQKTLTKLVSTGKDVYLIKKVISKFLFDKDVILAAIFENGLVLEYVVDELQADKEVVLAAVNDNGNALRFAADELRVDKQIVIAAVNQVGHALEYATNALRADKEVVLAAVNENGYALKYAAEDLRDDKEVVLAAVNENGNALQYAGDELRVDKEVVLAAVNTTINENGYALAYAADKIRVDKEVILAAVHNGCLQLTTDDLRCDKEVVLAAVNHDGESLRFAADDLQADKEVVLGI